MSNRFTRRELDAINAALAQVLAGEIEGDGEENAEALRDAMESAQRKVWQRLR